jgi:hypothetical protein
VTEGEGTSLLEQLAVDSGMGGLPAACRDTLNRDVFGLPLSEGGSFTSAASPGVTRGAPAGFG